MTALDGSRFAAHRQQLPSTRCDENTLFFLGVFLHQNQFISVNST